MFVSFQMKDNRSGDLRLDSLPRKLLQEVALCRNLLFHSISSTTRLAADLQVRIQPADDQRSSLYHLKLKLHSSTDVNDTTNHEKS